MYILNFLMHTKTEGGEMKDVMMLLGFSMGLLTGALLYKYSQGTKDMIDQGEKKIMKGAKQMEKKVEQGMDKFEKKVKDGMENVEDKVKSGMKNAENKLKN